MGYILATPQPQSLATGPFPEGLRFLNANTVEQLFIFPQDMLVNQPLEVNKLNNQVLVHYFEEEWSKYLD